MRFGTTADVGAMRTVSEGPSLLRAIIKLLRRTNIPTQ